MNGTLGHAIALSAANCSVIMDSKVAVELVYVQASPTRPEQPSPSVGGGMAAGSAFAHPCVANLRVRPIVFNHI